MAMTNNSAELFQAIDKTGLTALRSILKSLCVKSEAFEKAASVHLLLPASAASGKRSRADSDGSTLKPEAKKSRAVEIGLVSRYETCRTCGTEYDVTENDKDACQCHPGSVDVDGDEFPDDDEIQGYGPGVGAGYDWKTDWRFEEFPEGFIWDCCDRRQNEDPCIIRRHVAAGEPSPTTSEDEEDGKSEDEEFEHEA